MAKRTKRRHHVRASVQVGSLTKAGTSIDLEVFAANEKIGTLVIGRGSITWYGRKWRNGRSWSWSRFADFMENA
jgi:hypothetical protein